MIRRLEQLPLSRTAEQRIRVLPVLSRSCTDMPEPQQPHRSNPDKRCRGLLFTWVFRWALSDFHVALFPRRIIDNAKMRSFDGLPLVTKMRRTTDASSSIISSSPGAGNRAIA